MMSATGTLNLAGGSSVFTGNTFQNKPATIVVDPTCTASTIFTSVATS